MHNSVKFFGAILFCALFFLVSTTSSFAQTLIQQMEGSWILGNVRLQIVKKADDAYEAEYTGSRPLSVDASDGSEFTNVTFSGQGDFKCLYHVTMGPENVNSRSMRLDPHGASSPTCPKGWFSGPLQRHAPSLTQCQNTCLMIKSNCSEDKKSLLEACYANMKSRCIDDCTRHYGYSLDVCEEQMCDPKEALNVANFDRHCSSELDEVHECSSEYSSCLESCNN